MRIKLLPKTGEWDRTFLQCALVAGCMLLIAQAWVRFGLSGVMRQDIEETLWPLALPLGLILVCCSVLAAIGRRRPLGLALAVVAILLVIIALLPILLHEGIRN